MQKPLPNAQHLLIDLHGCQPQALDDLEGLRRVVYEMARILEVQPIEDLFHPFAPHGVTGVLVIAESHLSIHTWVEEGFCAADLFLCTPADPALWQAAVERLADFLGAERWVDRVVDRGAPE